MTEGKFCVHIYVVRKSEFKRANGQVKKYAKAHKREKCGTQFSLVVCCVIICFTCVQSLLFHDISSFSSVDFARYRVVAQFSRNLCAVTTITNSSMNFQHDRWFKQLLRRLLLHTSYFLFSIQRLSTRETKVTICQWYAQCASAIGINLRKCKYLY